MHLIGENLKGTKVSPHDAVLKSGRFDRGVEEKLFLRFGLVFFFWSGDFLFCYNHFLPFWVVKDCGVDIHQWSQTDRFFGACGRRRPGDA